MYRSEAKNTFASMSSHIQHNLIKQYESAGKFVSTDSLHRPATVGSLTRDKHQSTNVYKNSAKSLGKKFRNKVKSK